MKHSLNGITNSFVLIHGAWQSSYVWHSVGDMLRKLGHTVYMPDLPGHGNHLMDFNKIGLPTYVHKVQNIVEKAPGKVILVGHSMAGAVIGQVAENIPHKIYKLVYVAGIVPEYNGSIREEEQKASRPSVTLEAKINQEGGFISIKHSPKLRELFYGQCYSDLSKYAVNEIQHQPLRPFTDKVHLTQERFGSVPKLYIECLKDNAIFIEDQRRMHGKIECEVEKLNTDHSPFFSDSINLTKILTSVSRGQAARDNVERICGL